MKRGRRNERKAGGQTKGGEAEEESGRTGEGPEAMRSLLEKGDPYQFSWNDSPLPLDGPVFF